MAQDREKLQIYTTVLMLHIASVDGNVDTSEINVIVDIVSAFFNITKKTANELIGKAEDLNKEMTDIYEVASFVNNSFNLQDKIDLLACYFEVAYADGNLDFTERHAIKQIANILNINKEQLKEAKNEIKKYLL